MQRKQSATLSEVSDAERAVHELRRIRKEVDGLIAYFASRVPEVHHKGPVAVIDPRTGNEFRPKGR